MISTPSTEQPRFRLNKTLVLVGMMGSGKTAVGKAVAAALGVPFRDSDEEIVAASQSTIAEIFERDGEAFFREREAEVLSRLLDASPGVLSPGGGIFLRADNREKINASGVSVWLDAPLDLLWERVRHKDTRPLLRTADPRATLEALLNERRPSYSKAQLRLPVLENATIEDTASRVIRLLETSSDVLDPMT